jgi:hypothetical protein
MTRNAREKFLEKYYESEIRPGEIKSPENSEFELWYKTNFGLLKDASSNDLVQDFMDRVIDVEQLRSLVLKEHTDPDLRKRALLVVSKISDILGQINDLLIQRKDIVHCRSPKSETWVTFNGQPRIKKIAFVTCNHIRDRNKLMREITAPESTLNKLYKSKTPNITQEKALDPNAYIHKNMNRLGYRKYVFRGLSCLVFCFLLTVPFACLTLVNMIPMIGDYTLSDLKILGVHNWTPRTMVAKAIPEGYSEAAHPVSKEEATKSWQLRNDGDFDFQYYCKNTVLKWVMEDFLVNYTGATESLKVCKGVAEYHK